ncbi:MAG: hypothetical protein ACK4KW_15295, partial [Gemmobacter sp.]
MELQRSLFAAFCGGTGAELTLEDFLCSMAVLRAGREEERLHFLFNVYDITHTGNVALEDLRAAYLAFELRHIARSGVPRLDDALREVRDALHLTPGQQITLPAFKRLGALCPGSVFITWFHT